MLVTVVGNAPVVEPVGHIIDTSDIICRCNTFCVRGNEHLIGSRTTDLILSGIVSNMTLESLNESINSFSHEELKIVWLFNTTKSININWPYINHSTGFIDRYMKQKFNVQLGTDPKTGKICRPTAGLRAIVFYTMISDKPIRIVGFGPKDISLFGRTTNICLKDGRICNLADKSKHKNARLKMVCLHNWEVERHTINKLVDAGKVIRLENGVKRGG